MSSPHQLQGKILSLLPELYSICNAEEFPSKVLAACKVLIPAMYHSWMAVDMPQQALMEVAQLEPALTNPDEVHLAMKKHVNQHPCYVQAMEIPDSSVVLALSDFVTFREWQKTEFYHLVHKANGIRDQLVGGYKGPHGVFGLLLGRDKTFNSDERLAMELLQPHIVQSYINARRFASATKHPSSNPDHVVPLSKDGKVRDWPSSVLEALRHHSHAPILTYRVPVPEDFERWLHHSLLCLYKSEDVTATLRPYEAESEESRLVARLVAGHGAQRACLVFEVTPKQADHSALAQLGLTDRQQEIAYWISMGKRNDEIASIVGCALNTVRKHVENIFERMGVETRGAIGARVFEVLGRH